MGIKIKQLAGKSVRSTKHWVCEPMCGRVIRTLFAPMVRFSPPAGREVCDVNVVAHRRPHFQLGPMNQREDADNNWARVFLW